MTVHLLVRKDFDAPVMCFAREAIADHLDHDPEPNENISPRPRTTFQTGIFNIPSTLIGLDVSIGFWARRGMTQRILEKLQRLTVVSHTSALPDAAPIMIKPKARIEGLDITTDDFLHKISVTTHFDAHRGYIKDCETKRESGHYDETEFQRRITEERSRFLKLQSKGCIPQTAQCRCDV